MNQYATVSIKHNKPSDQRYYSETLAALVARDPRFNHPNMVVFIQTEKKYYYLKDDANGTALSHWVGLVSTALKFNQYDGQAHTVGEGVAVGSNMFICVVDAAPAEDPTNYPAKWMRLNAVSYLSVEFTNTDTVTINHSIQSPIVQALKADGTLVYGEIKHQTSTQVIVKFNHPKSGKIILK